MYIIGDFFMSVLKKHNDYVGLERIPVYIIDNDSNSRYFRIFDIPEIFPAGKTAFRINGSDLLKLNSEVHVEVLNENGKVIYSEYPDYVEGASRFVSVYVYPDEEYGEGLITVVGEAKNVPIEWQGIPNIRWQKSIMVNPSLRNSSPIRFYSLPRVITEELFTPYLVRTYSTSSSPETITYSSGLVIGRAVGSNYNISMWAGAQFNYQMIGGLLTVPIPDVVYGNSQSYVTRIRSITNAYTAVAQNPYLPTAEDYRLYPQVYTSTIMGVNTYGSKNFNASPYTLVYETAPTYSLTENYRSFVKATVANMSVFSGDVYSIKLYAKSVGSERDYELIGESVLESKELMIDSESVNTNERYGYFYGQGTIDSFWTASVLSSTSSMTGPSLTHTSEKLLDAMYVTGSSGIRLYRDYYTVYPLQKTNFYKDVEYSLDVKLYAIKKYKRVAITRMIDVPSARLLIFVSGSAFTELPTSMAAGGGFIEFSGNGKRIREINLTDTDNVAERSFGKVSINFIADKDGDGHIRFVIDSGDWHISDVSLRVSQETGFSPDLASFTIPTPSWQRQDTLEFKTEFYTYRGDRATLFATSSEVFYEGGNVYISGEDNLLTGSIFVGNRIDGGIQLTSVGASDGTRASYLKDVLYQGYYRATDGTGPGGFMIWSGSALDDLSTGLYRGIGLELHGGSASAINPSTGRGETHALRFRTDTGRLEITGSIYATDGYFSGGIEANRILVPLGGITGDETASAYYDPNSGNYYRAAITQQGYVHFMSGSIGGWNINSASLSSPGSTLVLSGDGTISSSHFFVSKDGDITASHVLFTGGTITEDVTILGSVTANSIRTPATIAGSPSTRENASSSIDTDGYALFRSASIGGWSISPSTIYSNNLILNSNGTIQTSNYVSDLTGWKITSDFNGYAEFENAKIRGTLRTTVFEKETVNAVGGQLWVANSTVISGSISASSDPSVASFCTWSVENASGWAVGEIALVKKVTDTGFSTEYVRIMSSSRDVDSSTKFNGKLYVQRCYQSNLQWAHPQLVIPGGPPLVHDSGSITGSYEPGQVIVSTGISGSGYIKINANPRDVYTPYIDIIERTGSGVYDVLLRARIGDLSGLSPAYLYGDTSPGHGIYTENGYFSGKVTATTGSFTGVVHAGGMRLGKNIGASSRFPQFVQGTGSWIDGYNHWFDNGYFSVGDVNSGLFWNPGTATLQISGSLNAVVGTIGGWKIAADALTSVNGAVYLSGSTGQIVSTGQITASNALIRGDIHAVNLYANNIIATGSGYIAGFSVSSGSISSSNAQLILWSNGQITASAALIKGDIHANNLYAANIIATGSGIIGGFGISSGSISSSNQQLILWSNGQITASAALIKGDITANSIIATGSGLIGGWRISPTSLSSGSVELNSFNRYIQVSSSVTDYTKMYYTDATNWGLLGVGGNATVFQLGSANKIGGWLFDNTRISASNIIIDSNGSLQTANYVSDLSGWRITSDFNGYAEFENVKIRGTLKTTVFEKETVNAVGGQLWIANSTVLSGSLTASADPTSPTFATWSVDNASGWAVGEIALVKKVSNTGFTTEYVKIVSSSLESDGLTKFNGKLYVSRSYQSNIQWAHTQLVIPGGPPLVHDSGSITGSYEPGQVIVSTGLSGSGYIKLNANPRDTYTPYIDIIERTGSGVYDVRLRARIGDLTGLSPSLLFGDTSPGHGIYTENGYFSGKIVATSGSFTGRVHAGGMLLGKNVGASSRFPQFVQGTGSWIDGYNHWFDNGYFSVGDASSGLSWDPGATTLRITGSLNATVGTIGGFSITPTAISSSNNSLILRGDSGQITASSALIRGDIYANSIIATGSGLIGGWRISPTSLSSGSVELNSFNRYIQVSSSATDYVKMHYTDATNWGIIGVGGGNTSFQLGSTNKIGGWYFDNAQITASNIIINSNGTIQSANYVSNLVGWRITSDFNGFAEFENAKIRGTLRTTVFEKESVNAVGGELWIANSTVLSGSVTSSSNPTNPTFATWSVENASGWAVGEIILVKKVSDTGFSTEYVRVASWSFDSDNSNTFNGKLYVSRSYQSNKVWQHPQLVDSLGIPLVNYTGSVTGSYEPGQVLVSTGISGSGFIKLNANPRDPYAPFMDIIERTGSGVFDVLLKARIGDLKGLSPAYLYGDTSPGYGIYTENGYFSGKVTATTGSFTGVVHAGGMRLGKNVGASSRFPQFIQGSGSWIDGYNHWFDNGYFSVGDANNGMAWNPGISTLQITGSLNATAGTIGGFSISSNAITSANSTLILRGDSGQITASNSLIRGDIHAVNLYANNIIATGSGYIAGFSVSSGSISSSNAQLILWSNGQITASAALIKGDIHANNLYAANIIATGSGYIAGFSVSSGSISSSNAQLILWSNGQITASAALIKGDIHANNLYAANIIATGSGLIGGWSIRSDALSSGAIELNSANRYIQVSSSATDYTKMYYTDVNDWGVMGVRGGSTVFHLGSTNSIGGWYFDSSSITASNLIISSNGTIQTANYVSDLMGWRITSNFNGYAEFENVKVRGTLRTTVFEKETVNAVGGQLWIANATVLSGSLTASDNPLSPTFATWSVENASGWSIGEIALVKKVNNTGFTTEYVKIVSSSLDTDSSTKFNGKLYVSRSYQSNLQWEHSQLVIPGGPPLVHDSGSITGSYEPGQVIVSTGLIGTGYIKLNANPRDQYTPYIDIIERTGSGVYDVQLKARIGDLSGLSPALLYGATSPGHGIYTENGYFSGIITADRGWIKNEVTIGGTNPYIDKNTALLFHFVDNAYDSIQGAKPNVSLDMINESVFGLVKSSTENLVYTIYKDDDIDDGAIVVESVTNNLIYNGAFNDALTPWTSSGNAYSVYSTNGFATGSCAEITHTAVGDTDNNFSQSISSIQIGAHHALSFYAKTLSGTASLHTKVSGESGKDFSLTTVWDRYYYTFNPTSSYGQVQFWLNGPGSYRLDQVQLERKNIATSFVTSSRPRGMLVYPTPTELNMDLTNDHTITISIKRTGSLEEFEDILSAKHDEISATGSYRIGITTDKKLSFGFGYNNNVTASYTDDYALHKYTFKYVSSSAMAYIYEDGIALVSKSLLYRPDKEINNTAIKLGADEKYTLVLTSSQYIELSANSTGSTQPHDSDYSIRWKSQFEVLPVSRSGVESSGSGKQFGIYVDATGSIVSAYYDLNNRLYYEVAATASALTTDRVYDIIVSHDRNDKTWFYVNGQTVASYSTVIPTGSFTDLITNGNFTVSHSQWTSSNMVFTSGAEFRGAAKHYMGLSDSMTGSLSLLKQNLTIYNGRNYYLSYFISQSIGSSSLYLSSTGSFGYIPLSQSHQSYFNKLITATTSSNKLEFIISGTLTSLGAEMVSSGNFSNYTSGSELVTNGNFSTISPWYTSSAARMNLTSSYAYFNAPSPGLNGILSQSISAISRSLYSLRYSVSTVNSTAGDYLICSGSFNHAMTLTVGNYTTSIEAKNSTNKLAFHYSSSNGLLILDNVSLLPVTSSWYTNNTRISLTGSRATFNILDPGANKVVLSQSINIVSQSWYQLSYFVGDYSTNPTAGGGFTLFLTGSFTQSLETPFESESTYTTRVRAINSNNQLSFLVSASSAIEDAFYLDNISLKPLTGSVLSMDSISLSIREVDIDTKKPLVIGRYTTTGSLIWWGMNGETHDLQFFNRFISQSEAQSLYDFNIVSESDKWANGYENIVKDSEFEYSYAGIGATNGWEIGNNATYASKSANISGSADDYPYIYQTFNLTAGEYYALSYDVLYTSSVAGDLYTNSGCSFGELILPRQLGTNKLLLPVTQGGARPLQLALTTGGKIILDNITLKKIGATLSLTKDNINYTTKIWSDESTNNISASLANAIIDSNITYRQIFSELHLIKSASSTNRIYAVNRKLDDGTFPPVPIEIPGTTTISGNKIRTGTIMSEDRTTEFNLNQSYIRMKKSSFADTANGLWEGIDGDGVAKLHLGNATNLLKWDGNVLTISGAINAKSGYFEGELSAGSLAIMPHTSPLLCYYPFDEGTGSVLLDQSSTDISVRSGSTLASYITYTSQSVSGYALNFANAATGTSGVRIHNIGPVTDKFTMTFWAKPLTLTTSNGGLFYIENWPTTSDYLQILIGTNGSITFYEGGGAPASVTTVSSSYFIANNWSFIALEIDLTAAAQSVKIYKYGELCETLDLSSLNGNIPSVGQLKFSIGKVNLPGAGGDKPYTGIFDEFRVYQGAIPTNELKGLYANPRGSSGTMIAGDQIKTGTIKSTNWDNVNNGSLIDLINGTMHLGGSGSGAALYFDGENLGISGSITAESGRIGGWAIGALGLTGSMGGQIATSQTGKRIVINSLDNTLRFYTGSIGTVGTYCINIDDTISAYSPFFGGAYEAPGIEFPYGGIISVKPLAYRKNDNIKITYPDEIIPSAYDWVGMDISANIGETLNRTSFLNGIYIFLINDSNTAGFYEYANGPNCGVESVISSNANYVYGIRANTTISYPGTGNPINTAVGAAVFAEAGASDIYSGSVYGVYGSVGNNTDGLAKVVGIYGVVSSDSGKPSNSWAGMFDGNVKIGHSASLVHQVTGSIQQTGSSNTNVWNRFVTPISSSYISIANSGSITGSLRVKGEISGTICTPARSVLSFGFSGSFTAVGGATRVADACTIGSQANTQGYRMFRNGRVTGVSVQCVESTGSTDAQGLFIVTPQLGGVNQSMAASFVINIAKWQPNGFIGAVSTNNPFGFISGSTINVEMQIQETEAGVSVTADEIAILVEIET